MSEDCTEELEPIPSVLPGWAQGLAYQIGVLIRLTSIYVAMPCGWVFLIALAFVLTRA